jgi:hypothetical protein
VARRDRVSPREESTFATELGQVPDDLQEHVLGRVARQIRAADDAQGEAKEGTLQLPAQPLQRRSVAGESALGKLPQEIGFLR